MRKSAGPLRPGELAEAAVFGDLAAALMFLGWMLPFGGVLQVLSVVPLALLAARRRARAVIAAGITSGAVCFLVGGIALWSWALIFALVGWAVGAGIRRGWSQWKVAGAAVAVWVVLAVTSVGQLVLFAGLRRLTLDQIRNSWHGTRRVLGHLSVLHPLLHVGDVVVAWCLRNWWLVIGLSELVAVELATWAAGAISRPAVRRVGDALGPPMPPGAAVEEPPGAPAPVPVTFASASVAWPDGPPVLRDVDLELPAGALVAVVGDNGSGKSTLARAVAGMLPVEGTLHRPGAPGLGRPGGTAVVFQRPESQVLGVRVRDDLVWGLPPGTDVDVDGLLARVGLTGLADAETSTLSGGQLQRLAVAAALARRPALLVSDESTSMLDPVGRRQVTDLLRGLVVDQGLTVVHVTHRAEETEGADAVVSVADGRVVDSRVVDNRVVDNRVGEP